MHADETRMKAGDAIEELDALVDQGLASGSSGVDARESLRRLRAQLTRNAAGE
jgi:hypothetical protein